MITPKFRWLVIISLTTLVIGNMYLNLQYRRDLPKPTLIVGTSVDIASDVIAIEYKADTNIISIITYNGWNFTGSADFLNRIPSVNEFIRIRGICQPEGYVLIQEGYVMSTRNIQFIQIASFGGYVMILVLWVIAGFKWVKNSRKGPISGAILTKEK